MSYKFFNFRSLTFFFSKFFLVIGKKNLGEIDLKLGNVFLGFFHETESAVNHDEDHDYRFYAKLNLRKLFFFTGLREERRVSPLTNFGVSALSWQAKMWYVKYGRRWPVLLSVPVAGFNVSRFGGSGYNFYYNNNAAQTRIVLSKNLTKRVLFRPMSNKFDLGFGGGGVKGNIGFTEKYFRNCAEVYYTREQFLPYNQMQFFWKFALGVRGSANSLIFALNRKNVVPNAMGFFFLPKRVLQNKNFSSVIRYSAYGAELQCVLLKKLFWVNPRYDIIALWLSHKKWVCVRYIIKQLGCSISVVNACIGLPRFPYVFVRVRPATTLRPCFEANLGFRRSGIARVGWLPLIKIAVIDIPCVSGKALLHHVTKIHGWGCLAFCTYNELLIKLCVKLFLPNYVDCKKIPLNWYKGRSVGNFLVLSRASSSLFGHNGKNFSYLTSVFNRKLVVWVLAYKLKKYMHVLGFTGSTGLTSWINEVFLKRYESGDLKEYNFLLRRAFTWGVGVAFGLRQNLGFRFGTKGNFGERLLAIKGDLFNPSSLGNIGLGAAALLATKSSNTTSFERCNERAFFDNMLFRWAVQGLSPKHSEFFYFLSGPNVFSTHYSLPSTVTLFNPFAKAKPLRDNFGAVFDDSLFDNFSDILLTASRGLQRSAAGERVAAGAFGASTSNFDIFRFFEFPEAGASFFFNQLDGLTPVVGADNFLLQQWEPLEICGSQNISTFFVVNPPTNAANLSYKHYVAGSCWRRIFGEHALLFFCSL